LTLISTCVILLEYVFSITIEVEAPASHLSNNGWLVQFHDFIWILLISLMINRDVGSS